VVVTGYRKDDKGNTIDAVSVRATYRRSGAAFKYPLQTSQDVSLNSSTVTAADGEVAIRTNATKEAAVNLVNSIVKGDVVVGPGNQNTIVNDTGTLDGDANTVTTTDALASLMLPRNTGDSGSSEGAQDIALEESIQQREVQGTEEYTETTTVYEPVGRAPQDFPLPDTVPVTPYYTDQGTSIEGKAVRGSGNSAFDWGAVGDKFLEVVGDIWTGNDAELDKDADDLLDMVVEGVKYEIAHFFNRSGRMRTAMQNPTLNRRPRTQSYSAPTPDRVPVIEPPTTPQAPGRTVTTTSTRTVTRVENYTQAGGTQELAPGNYGNVTLSGGGKLILDGGTYSFNNVNVLKNGTLARKANARERTVIFIRGNLKVEDGALANGSELPRDLVLLGTSPNGTWSMKNAGTTQAAVYAPGSNVSLDASSLLGALVANSVSARAGSSITYDADLRKTRVDGTGPATIVSYESL
jgi:hypothetical protein